MKMRIKSIFLSMLAVAGLASCSSDNNDLPGGGENEIANKFLAINLKVDGENKTRATTAGADQNQITGESDIKSVKVFIFKGEVIEAIASGADDVIETVRVTDGNKTGVALVNYPAEVNNIVVGQTLTDLKNYIHEVSLGDAETHLAKTKEFKMQGASPAPISVTNSTDKDNPVTMEITVERLAAKVLMKVAPTIAGPDATAKVGKISDLKFTLAQVNKKAYLYRSNRVSPVGMFAEQVYTETGTAGHLTRVPAVWGDNLMQKVADIQIANNWDYSRENSVFLAENVNDKSVWGNASFALIEMVVQPEGFTANTTFYAVYNKTDKAFVVDCKSSA